MASAAVAELEAGLSAMLAMKAPGVSTSKIKSLTELCQNNIKDESLIVQKFYTHFRKAPPTHKLGVLYLIDSVVRKWVDRAKQQQQEVSSSAQDGTFAAGVYRVTEVLPALMDNILPTIPQDQKDRVRKLVEIWARAQTFPPKYLDKFRQQLKAATADESTTPPGSPPPGLPGMPGTESRSPQPPSRPQVPNNIMDMLANLAKQGSAPAQPAPAQVPTPTSSAPPAGHGLAMPAPHQMGGPPGASLYGNPTPALPTSQPYAPPQQAFVPPAQPPVPSAALTSFPPQLMAALGGQQTPAGAPPPFPGLMPGVPPAAAPGAPGAPPASGINQVLLIKSLIDQGLQPEQISAVLQMTQQASAAGQAFPPMPMQAPPNGGWGPGPQPDIPRDHGVDDRHRYGDRSRSRSPTQWGGRDGRSGYDKYGRDRGHDVDHDRARNAEYRHRSPVGHRSPNGNFPGRPPARRVEIDRSIQGNKIKVLSRTLFVGGVSCSESELRELFNRVGPVQSVIINKDKRHAFVKMLTRDVAVDAKKAMGEFRGSGLQLRTRWGVGFGPRDCCDYETGVSVIPINRLTEADKKWLLTAEYGGTGGSPIENGIVVEEPDIEIGAGVSSKAISRRIQTDKGGSHGPKSTRKEEEQSPAGGRGGDGGGRGGGRGGGDRQRRDPRRDDRDYQSNVNPNHIAPAGYSFAGAMPTYPGGAFNGYGGN